MFGAEQVLDLIPPIHVLLFTHAPRFVDTVTSGETVTIRAANSSSPLAISCINKPKACCVDMEGCLG